MTLFTAMQVLYDFCVARSEFPEAAAAQLALARRLREEAPARLDTLQHALGARNLNIFPSCTKKLLFLHA